MGWRYASVSIILPATTVRSALPDIMGAHGPGAQRLMQMSVYVRDAWHLTYSNALYYSMQISVMESILFNFLIIHSNNGDRALSTLFEQGLSNNLLFFFTTFVFLYSTVGKFDDSNGDSAHNRTNEVDKEQKEELPDDEIRNTTVCNNKGNMQIYQTMYSLIFKYMVRTWHRLFIVLSEN